MKNHSPFICVIIDDEPKAITILTELIEETTLVDSILSYSDLNEAKIGIVKAKPDVIFMDIQMPGQNGIDFHDELRELGIVAPIVFVSAFDHYAIQAIKRHAYDFIIKPVEFNELNKTLIRIYNSRNQSVSNLNSNQICFNTEKAVIFIDFQDVIYFEAQGNYTVIFKASSDKVLVTKSIGVIEKMDTQGMFLRIHRKYLVNRSYLLEINKTKHNCTLKCSSLIAELPVSRRCLSSIINQKLNT